MNDVKGRVAGAIKLSLCAAIALMCSCSTEQASTTKRAATSSAPSYRTIDLMPFFWEFWSRASGLPLDEQKSLLKSMIIDRHPEVYTHAVLGLDANRPLDEAVGERYERWLPLIASHVPTMKQVSQKVAADLPRYESSFKQSFPDMRYDGEVYFLCSFGGFDGATRMVQGKQALLFGVDMIAYVYGTHADPQPFFHHELFHIYHSQFFVDDSDRLYSGLWREGLATYVAKSLNPSAAGVNLFGLPLDMPERAQAMLPQLARELRENLDSTSRDTYEKFFFGKNSHPDVPARSGYYVGFLVAEKLGRGQKLSDLAKLKGPELRQSIEAALREIESKQ